MSGNMVPRPNELGQPTIGLEKGPSSYSARVNVTTRASTVGIGEGLELSPGYLISWPGILKIVQLITAIICMICISPPLTWFSRLFTAGIAISFAVTLLLIFAYLVKLSRVVFNSFNWTFIELMYTGFFALCNFITSIIHISLTNRDDWEESITYYGYYGAYIAAGVFGLINSLAYALASYFLFLEWREERKSSTVMPSTR